MLRPRAGKLLPPMNLAYCPQQQGFTYNFLAVHVPLRETFIFQKYRIEHPGHLSALRVLPL
jgi:hypothetical protein